MFKKHLNISKYDVNVTVKVHRKNQIKPLYLKGIVNAVVNSECLSQKRHSTSSC